MSRLERGTVVRPEGQRPWVAREPHYLMIGGDVSGDPAPGEFSTMVRGVGCVTVCPGRDADWDEILVTLRMMAGERGWADRRVLYHEGHAVHRVGAYPDGARLQWGRP